MVLLPTKLLFLEFQRSRVHAVAKMRGSGAVLEYVAHVRVAFLAQHFGSLHEKTFVRLGSNVLIGHRLRETRPPGTGLELGAGVVRGGVAADAAEHALAMLFQQRAGERALGARGVDEVRAELRAAIDRLAGGVL